MRLSLRTEVSPVACQEALRNCSVVGSRLAGMHAQQRSSASISDERKAQWTKIFTW